MERMAKWVTGMIAVLLSIQVDAADSVADATHSLIDATGAEKRDLPVHPGFSYSRVVGFFRADHMIGVQTFYPDGTLAAEDELGTVGREGLCRTWHSNGMICTAVPYHLGMIDGLARQWSPNGQLIGSYLMVRGTGEEIIWQNDGTIAFMAGFVDGKRFGLSISYHPDGSVKRVESFRNDLQDGPSRTFYRSHKLEQISTYREGHMIGPLLILDEAGTPIEGTPSWILHDVKISREAYDKARVDDPGLPPTEVRSDVDPFGQNDGQIFGLGRPP